MTNNRLFKQLQEEEEKLFGEKSFPLSTNITGSLIPVAKVLLNRIPAFMPEYTLHDISHCEAVLENIAMIIPSEFNLNIVELVILIQAVLLHDIGMVVNKTIAGKIKESEDYKKLFIEFDNDVNEDQILTEYIRRTHVTRSLEYIDDFIEDFSTYKISFDFKCIDISDWVKNVVESHALSISSLEDDEKYPTEKLIDSFTVNIRYLSVLLRLGDILDFDIFRTPYFLYKHINPENKISDLEWQKHLSIEGFKINESTIKFEAKCSSAKIERSVHSFISWIENERKESITLLAKSNSSCHKLKLEESVSVKVRNDGSYLYTDLKLDLDYKKVLNILMGTELYETPDIFIRELLQNSYDACKYRQEVAMVEGETFEPQISVNYDSKSNILIVEDNGIGIDSSTFENYVLKIGNSYYKSKSFERENLSFTPISNFGIGILSCFMVSNTIEIESYKYQKSIEKCRPISYTLHFEDRYIDKKNNNKMSFGTRIRLSLHDEYAEKLKIKNIVDIIKENTAHQKIPIKINIDNHEILLKEQEIIIPEDYNTICDIEIIQLNKVKWLEGFIVVHKGQHQEIIDHNKISQQGFTITTKSKNNIKLNIGWLQFCRFFINILPENKLNLKASRNNIKEDEKLTFLRNSIIELLVDYFLEPKNKALLTQYLNSGRGPVLSGNPKEFDFLIENVYLHLFNPQSLQISKVRIKTFLNKCKNETKIIVISSALLFKFSKNPYFITELKTAEYIIYSDEFINYFYQFAKPFTISNEIVISDIPGVVFNKLIVHKTKSLHVDKYKLKYSWHRTYDFCHNNNYQDIFCVVNNNQYNSMDIQINEQHRLGKVLKDNDKISYTKRFLGSLKTNITGAIINNQKLENYTSFNGELHYMVNNYHPYSINTIGFMKKIFLEGLNKSMKDELLIPLKDQNFISDAQLSLLFTEDDFPNWWFDKKY
ncbi:MAG: hypothetical protein GY739_05960 [Mesoflavibacter sp.]|nr:hypothetical protein [Mesoflavibacter sp.]